MNKRLFLSILCSLCLFSTLSAYKYEVSALMVFKNEAPYLREWIEYHKLIGVNHFYLINHQSEDNYQEVLQPYIDQGLVDLYDCDEVRYNEAAWVRLQTTLYNEMLNAKRKETKWMMVIDSDEFYVPCKVDTIQEMIEPYERANFSSLYTQWVMFGTSNVEKLNEDDLMIERLWMNSGFSHLGKSIVRPDRVRGMATPHRPNVLPKITRIKILPKDEAQINHYWSRDEWYAWNVKWPRREKWGMRPWTFREKIDSANKEGDESMALYRRINKYVLPLKNQMGGEAVE